ncbi:MAG: rod shape-determining protein RodA [Gemmatimonadetes bacterium]|nr:rod shape-determining protein RodA [Gemmatimonadota bacterium]HAC06071.1 rod shape-determining protein RodA [Gemmatimonadota bacterium]HIN49584.1 rod shape-determining protein RodA [Gemmatimonadota bacterium]
MTRLLEKWAVDPPLVFAIFAMTLFGIAMIYSAGVVHIPNAVTQDAWVKQAAWFAIALVAFTVLARVPLRWIEWVAVPSYVVGVLLLAITLVIGTGAGTAIGVKSWIRIGGFGFQPSEFAKIATILMLARVLSQRKEPLTSLRDLLLPSVLVGLPLALIMLQPDLGTALAFGGILFAILFWAGTPVALLLLVASPGVGLVLSFDTRIWSAYIVGVVAFLYLYRYRLFLFESVAVVLANVAAGTISRPLWESLKPYQQNRILVFLDPEVDARGAGYQVIQSKVAVGSGGLTGQGFTLGPQKRYDFLPEQHTDFIFSVVGEELGFLGTMAAILGFAFILTRLVRMAEESPDPFAGLVLLGILGAWLVHIFVNVGMTVGVVPITGIPLPFVSYGGTFLLMSWVAVAIAVRVAHER